MFSSFTSSSEFRFVVVILAALAALLLLDDALYGHRLYLKFFGEATEEGQVLAKEDRFHVYARDADVILFGSSFTRSGIASEPFTASGKLVFNAGVSGGGPLYSYFALKDMAGVLRERDAKPLLVLELNPDAFLRQHSEWSEYPQFVALVRERYQVLQEFPLLLENYLDYGQASRFLSGFVFPSLIYREHNRKLIHELYVRLSSIYRGNGWHVLDGIRDLLKDGFRPMEGYFIGMEDHGGYAPIYGVAPRERCVDLRMANAALPLEALEPTKIEFVRRFLALATSIGVPVLLSERPNNCHDELMTNLVDLLRREYPSLGFLPSREFGLDVQDYELKGPGAHPNIWGADKVARRIVRRMAAMRLDAPAAGRTFQARWSAIHGQPLGVKWDEWVAGVSDRPDGGLGVAGIEKLYNDRPTLIAKSAEIAVLPGREYVLESEAAISSGLMVVGLQLSDPKGGAEYTEMYQLPECSRSFRHFIRFRPKGNRLRIELFDGEPRYPLKGEFAILRLIAA